jgi:hypothetical protein
MTPLLKFIRDAWQKFTSRYYEGPEPPSRFGEIAALFANDHPDATRLDWTMFASEHARCAYREGFLRGMEYSERDLEELRALKDLDPETLADALDPNWRTNDPVQLNEPEERIPERVGTEAEEVERLLRGLKT